MQESETEFSEFSKMIVGMTSFRRYGQNHFLFLSQQATHITILFIFTILFHKNRSPKFDTSVSFVFCAI